MTRRAVATVAHVGDLVIVVHRLVMTHHGEIRLQLLARVDLVNHRLEIDRFRRVARLPLRRIRRRRVVAHHTELHTLPVTAVEVQRVVAPRALRLAHHLPPRRHFGAVHGEVEHFVHARVAYGRRIHGARVDSRVLVTFDAHSSCASRTPPTPTCPSEVRRPMSRSGPGATSSPSTMAAGRGGPIGTSPRISTSSTTRAAPRSPAPGSR